MFDPAWDDREPSLAECRREVVGLHDFFVEWFTGRVDEGDNDRVADALATGFDRIDPDGERQDRAAVLDSIRESHDAHGTEAFDIDIRDVRLAASGPGFAVVQYEEWQSAGDDTNGRISSATLRPTADAPSGLAWVSLQETWLDE